MFPPCVQVTCVARSSDVRDAMPLLLQEKEEKKTRAADPNSLGATLSLRTRVRAQASALIPFFFVRHFMFPFVFEMLLFFALLVYVFMRLFRTPALPEQGQV